MSQTVEPIPTPNGAHIPARPLRGAAKRAAANAGARTTAKAPRKSAGPATNATPGPATNATPAPGRAAGGVAPRIGPGATNGVAGGTNGVAGGTNGVAGGMAGSIAGGFAVTLSGAGPGWSPEYQASFLAGLTATLPFICATTGGPSVAG